MHKEGGNEVEKISLVGKNIAFCGARLAGTVFAGGADAVGTIADHTALKKAYEMGKAVSDGKE